MHFPPIGQILIIAFSLYFAAVVTTNLHNLLTKRLRWRQHWVGSVTSVSFVLALLTAFVTARRIAGI